MPVLFGSALPFPQGRGVVVGCCCPEKHRDALKNVDSPENLAASAGVFGSRSGRPSLRLSGCFVFQGLGPSNSAEHTLHEASTVTEMS